MYLLYLTLSKIDIVDIEYIRHLLFVYDPNLLGQPLRFVIKIIAHLIDS